MGKHIYVQAVRIEVPITHEKNPQKFFSGIGFQ